MAKHLTEEKLNLNYILWTKKCQQYGCYSEELVNDIGERLRTATFSMQDNTGSAYEGALLDVVLYNLCNLAICVANSFDTNSDKKGHPELVVDKTALMRVLLLQHIGKVDIFTVETQDWKIKNGNFYKFSDNNVASLKLGERSIFMCMKYGIKLTEEEFEAIRIIDKDDDKTGQYTNPLCAIVRIANQLTAIECYRRTLTNK